LLASGGKIMPFLKFEYAVEAREKLNNNELPSFDGGVGFDYLEKEKKLYYLPSVTGNWELVGDFDSKDQAIEWLSERLKMEGFANGGSTQGYDDREDERLAMKYGKIANKDLDSTHSRRDDARFEERGKMAKGGEIEFQHSNIRIIGTDMDSNGNRVVKVSFPNQRAFSIQTNGDLPKTHNLLQGYDEKTNFSAKEIESMEDEIIDYVKNYGSANQKKSLRLSKDYLPKNNYAKGGKIQHTFKVGEIVSFPTQKNRYMDKPLLDMINHFSNKELVIEKINEDKPYNLADVYIKDTGEKLRDLILNPNVLKIYEDDEINSNVNLSGYKQLGYFDTLEYAKEYVDEQRKKFPKAKTIVIEPEDFSKYNAYEVWGTDPLFRDKTGKRLYANGGGIDGGMNNLTIQDVSFADGGILNFNDFDVENSESNSFSGNVLVKTEISDERYDDIIDYLDSAGLEPNPFMGEEGTHFGFRFNGSTEDLMEILENFSKYLKSHKIKAEIDELNESDESFAKGGGVASKSTFRANNSPLLEYANFKDGSHINLIRFNPLKRDGTQYKSGYKFVVSVQEFKKEQQILSFKTLEKAKEKFDTLVETAKSYKELLNEGKTNNYANGGSLPFMTDPNFGNFQNTGAFADGGLNESKEMNSFIEKLRENEVVNEVSREYSFSKGKLIKRLMPYVKVLKHSDGSVKEISIDFTDKFIGKTVKEKMTFDKFELGGAFMMTDLAGHTGGSDGLGNPMPLSGVSGTYYTGLVGETGAMSSGELFAKGGALHSEHTDNPLKYLSLMGAKTYGDLNYSTSKNGIDYYIGRKKDKNGENKAIVVAFITDENNYMIDKEDAKEMSETAKEKGVDKVELYTNYGVELRSSQKPQILGFDKIFKVMGNYEAGGVMAQNQQVINDASQSYVNYYLGEGASQGIYKEGGSIPNNYEGRTPEDVWNKLTIEQREHFLYDHIYEINRFDLKKQKKLTLADIEKAESSDWLMLDFAIKETFKTHIRMGQYAKGGAIKNQYEGRTPEDVWNNWTVSQKKHFVSDHFEVFSLTIPEFSDWFEKYGEFAKNNASYDTLPPRLKSFLKDHISEGQYASGGSFKDGGALESRMKTKLSQNFSLPLQVAVYVPSTKDADEKVSKKEFDNRVEEVEKFTSSLFGGFSANDVDGGYMSNTKGLIKEEVYKVTSFAPKENFDAKMSQLIAQVKKWAKDWGQESIGLEFEGDLFYIEQGGSFASGGSLGKALYVEYSSYFTYNKYDEEKMMSVLEKIGAKNIRLENDRGWSNQPEVVVFNGDRNKAQDALNEAFDTDYIRVREKDWRTKKMADGGFTPDVSDGTQFMSGVYANGGSLGDVSGNYYSTTDFVSQNDLMDLAKSTFGQDWESGGDYDYDTEEIKMLVKKLGGGYKIVYVDSEQREKFENAKSKYLPLLKNKSNDGDIFVIPNKKMADGGFTPDVSDGTQFMSGVYAKGGETSRKGTYTNRIVILDNGDSVMIGNISGYRGTGEPVYDVHKYGSLRKNMLEKQGELSNNKIKELLKKDKYADGGFTPDVSDGTQFMSGVYAKGGSVDDSIIDELWSGYASAVLFTETDSDSGEPLDSEYSISDFDKETVTSTKKMLAEFYSKNKEAIEESELDLDTIGNDVWYTRSGQGAGFFDHSLDAEVEEKLTKGAKALGEYPSVETYDGKISVRGGRTFAKGGFVGTVEFNAGDVVWQKDDKGYATVMNNYGDPINGDYGDVRLDTTGNTSIYSHDPKRKTPATIANATGYNLIKVGEKGDAGKFTPEVLAEMKESANRLINYRKEAKDKEGTAYYQEVYKRLLDGEFDSMTGAKATAPKKTKKQLREEYLENVADETSEVWDKIGASSGGQIREDQKLLKAYADGTEEVMQKMGVKKGTFDRADYDYYTDNNAHLFNDFLVFNGYYNANMTKSEKEWRLKAFDEDIKQYGKSKYISNPDVITVSVKTTTSNKKGSKDYTYVPNKDVKELSVVIDSESKELKGSDILDGVYVKNSAKFADGGFMNNVYSHGGQMEVNDINSELEDFDLDNLDTFETMQYDNYSKSMSKVDALQILINTVEGDYSQLSPELAELAEKQISSQEWEEQYYRDNGFAKGGGVGFKPYGNTKGKFKITYIADGKKQSEIRETLEMAIDTAKRYKKYDEFSKIEVFDESGKKIMADGGFMNDVYAKGGSTDSLSVNKASILSATKKCTDGDSDYNTCQSGNFEVIMTYAFNSLFLDFFYLDYNNPRFNPSKEHYASYAYTKGSKGILTDFDQTVYTKQGRRTDAKTIISKTIEVLKSLGYPVDSIVDRDGEEVEDAKYADGGFMNDVYADGGEIEDIETIIKKFKRLIERDYKYYDVVEYIAPAKRPLTDGEYLKIVAVSDAYGDFDSGLGRVIKKYLKVEPSFVDKGYGFRTYWVYLKDIKGGMMADGGFMNNVYADGGFLNENQIEKLDEGFTISQLNDMLNQMFPYSFRFEVYKRTQNVTMLGYDYKDKLQSDDKIKLYFHQKGYDRDLNYEVQQGQENTYFTFLLSDKDSNGYIGTFGFKDDGDVDSSYITKFISFLQDAYHYPFQVRHSVMADGGFMNDVYADGGEIRRFNRHEQMDAETREEVLDVVSDTKLNGILTNYLYGLYDGYDYSQTEQFKKEMRKLKSKDLNFYNRVNAIYEKIDKYKFEKYDSYADGGEIKDIQKMKKTLIAKAKSRGLYENFGQKEVRVLEDKYGYTNNVREFDNWAMNFDLSQMADGGMFEENDGFMKADNEFNYRYPEMEVYVETLDEPIDLTSNVSSRSNKVVIKPLDENIDLNDDNRVRATMGYNPKNRNPEKFSKINPRAFEFIDLPMPTSNTHKND
jgi:hypothetical protein